MSDGGKGDKRRPTDEAAYAEGWERIWGQSRRSVPASDGYMGCSSTAEQGALTASVVGSSPTAPASYVDDATGAAVDADWWPGDKLPKGLNR